MGVTKDLSLAMTERTINCTFKVLAKDENGIMNYLHEATKVVNYQVVPDTTWLWDNDTTFRRISKAASEKKKEKQDYINKHNKK